MKTLIDLSHPLHVGMQTTPGLPGPSWEAHRTREEYPAATGTDFQIDRVTMVGNTGTYLDNPFHRFADGGDLAGVPLASAADLPILLVDARGTRAVDMQVLDEQLADATLEGAAVLLHTGSDRDFGTPGHDVLVLEHLTRLGEVPPGGARLHAAPPAGQGVGTWPVRAYVVVERRADRQALGQSTDSAGRDGSGVPH